MTKKVELGTVVSLGRSQLKNIDERFQVYALLPETPKGLRRILQVQWLKASRRMRPAHRVAMGLMLLVGVITATWYFARSPLNPQSAALSPQASLPLPDKPSIVVLPFANMSDDPKQDYFEGDPQYAEAYALRSMTYTLGWLNGWNRTPQVLERWSEVVRNALALDASLPVAHQSLAWLALFQRQHEQAIAAAKQIIALDPNWAEGHLTLGTMLNFAGPPGGSIEWIEQAMRLNPRYGPEYPLALGWAYVIAGRYEEALVPLTQALPLVPNNLQLQWALVICYVELGREEEAQAAAGEMLRIAPHFSTEASRPFMPNKDPARTEYQLAALRKAGLK